MPPTSQEAFADLSYPVHGLDLTGLFSGQLPETTRDAANVRAFEPAALRARGGSRPGLAKFVDSQLPLTYSSGLRVIQNLQTVVTTDGEALLNTYPFDPPLVTDPSDVGLASSWPPGRNSRVPLWSFPYGGTPVMPYKNGKRTPVIAWANPAAIQLGTVLSGTQLNAAATDPAGGAAVAGSFVYSPASGTTPSVGLNQSLRTTFTPTDTTTYNTVRGLAHLDVVPVSGISFVQKKVAGLQSTAAASTAFSSNVSSGNLLLVAIATMGGPAAANPITSLTDTRGNVYVQIGTYVRIPGGLTQCEISLWYAVANGTGACTVNWVATDTNNSGRTTILEYTGNSAAPLDDSITNLVSGSFPTAFTTGSVPVAQAGDLVVGFFATAETTTALAADAGFTDRGNFSDAGNSGVTLVEEKVPQASALAMTCTSDGDRYVAIGASFKAA